MAAWLYLCRATSRPVWWLFLSFVRWRGRLRASWWRRKRCGCRRSIWWGYAFGRVWLRGRLVESRGLESGKWKRYSSHAHSIHQIQYWPASHPGQNLNRISACNTAEYSSSTWLDSSSPKRRDRRWECALCRSGSRSGRGAGGHSCSRRWLCCGGRRLWGIGLSRVIGKKRDTQIVLWSLSFSQRRSVHHNTSQSGPLILSYGNTLKKST